jgi:chitinase
LPVLDQALKGLKAANPNLVVSFTLPVLPTGLISSGTAVLNQAHKDGLNPDVINVMTMDYGSSVDNGGQMGLDATLAAQAVHTQIQQAGLSSSVGITPMVGQNDTGGEIFQLSDVNTVLMFANSNSYVTRLSFWSLSRDNGGCPGQKLASATCSGIAQNTYQFSQSFEPF